MEFKITDKTLQEVLNYMAKKPFIEVAELINALQRLEKIEEIKEETKEETKNAK